MYRLKNFLSYFLSLLTLKEIPRVLGDVSQDEDQMSYKSQYCTHPIYLHLVTYAYILQLLAAKEARKYSLLAGHLAMQLHFLKT